MAVACTNTSSLFPSDHSTHKHSECWTVVECGVIQYPNDGMCSWNTTPTPHCNNILSYSSNGIVDGRCLHSLSHSLSLSLSLYHTVKKDQFSLSSWPLHHITHKYTHCGLYTSTCVVLHCFSGLIWWKLSLNNWQVKMSGAAIYSVCGHHMTGSKCIIWQWLYLYTITHSRKPQ